MKAKKKKEAAAEELNLEREMGVAVGYSSSTSML